MIDRQREAWRGNSGGAPTILDARRRKPDDEPDEDDDEVDDAKGRWPAIRARDLYVASLADAWKTPSKTKSRCVTAFSRDAAAVSTGPGPAGSRSPPGPFRAPERPVPGGAEPDMGTRPEELQARREATFQEYSTMISNAWGNPPGRRDPTAAGRIERAREVVHGGR
jgi:hypothetical protein